jgi:tellurite resistance-related uncharacterized protein
MPTEKQVADRITKALPQLVFEQFKNALGVFTKLPQLVGAVRVSSLLMGQPIVAQALLVLSLLSSQTLFLS